MGGLIQQTIPGLYNGVSQQPPSLRIPNQGEVQENAVGDLVRGLYKRPPTEFIDKLEDTIDIDSFVHEINRDTQERYLVFFTNNADKPIVVYDLINKEEVTVNYGHLDEDLELIETEAVKDYLVEGLNDLLPKHRIRATTVADYTIITNTTVKPEMTGIKTDSRKNIAVVDVHNWFEKEITINFDGSTEKISDIDEDSSIDDVAKAIEAELDAMDATVERSGHLIRVSKGGSEFDLDLPHPDIYVRFRSVPNYEDLWTPTTFPDDDDVVRVLQNQYGEGINYYVRSDGENWIETVGFDQEYEIDRTTMPHRLVRMEDGTFVFATINWTEKEVGDENSAPTPSFIGTNVENVFFYQNRLGLLTQTGVVMSRADRFFNFWPSTAMEVLDDDPIDIGVATTEITTLREVLPFNKNMLLRADTDQFILSYSGGMLSPQTVSIDQTTRYTTIPKSLSSTVGSTLYFFCPNQNHLTVREYFVQPDSLVEDATNVTKHVPTYIPYSEYVEMKSASMMDVSFLLTGGERDVLYVYQHFHQGDEKVQNAWSRWKFSDDIIGISVIGSNLYVVFQVNGKNLLTRISLNAEPRDTFHLDKKVRLEGEYDGDADETIFELPWVDPDTDWNIVDPETKLALTDVQKNPNSSLVAVPGDHSDKEYVLGQTYEMLYEPTRWFVRDQQGNSIMGVLKLRSFLVSFTDTGFFKIRVIYRGREDNPFDIKMSGFKLGESGLDQANFIDDERRYSITGDTNKMKIQLRNDSHLSSIIQTVTYEGFFHTRAEVG